MPKQGPTPRLEVTTVNFTASGILRILCMVGAAVVFWRLMNLVMIILIAFIVASAILPLALRLEKHGVSRVWTMVGLLVLLLTSIVVLSIVTAPAIGAQLKRLVIHAPEQVNRASVWLTRRLSSIAGHPVRTPEVSGQIAQYVRTAAERTLQVTVRAADAIASLILIVVITGYMVIDHRRFRAGFLRLAPSEVREIVAKQWDQVQESMGGYMAGLAFIALEKSVVLTVALWLIGVPSAMLLGLLAGVLSFIPFVGFWSVFLLAELLAFNTDPMKGMWVFVLFIGHEWFKSGLLGPYLVGRTMKMHPAVVLVAIAAGAKLGGVLGTLVAVPLAAAVSIVVTNLRPASPNTIPPDAAIPEGALRQAAESGIRNIRVNESENGRQ